VTQINKEYSEKEKSIFKGIIELLNQGYKIHELKVSDIAVAAGIGKGTVYEYFSTKEEIIRQAVSYYVFKEYEAFVFLIKNENNFGDMLYKILDYMIDMLKFRFTSLLFMVISMGESDIKQFICEDNEFCAKIRSGINQFIMEMYKRGKKEHLIGENVTLEDCRLVLKGILSSFTNEVIIIRSKSLCADTITNEESLESLKERAVKLILKALR